MEKQDKPIKPSKEEMHQKAMENAKKVMEIINKHNQENKMDGDER